MRLEIKASALILGGIFLALGRLLAGSWGNALLFAAMLGASLLLHECGHAFVAHAHGVEVKAIGFSAAGAYTRRSLSTSKGVELQAASAGPMVNLAIGIALMLLPGKIAATVATCNLLLCATNLLPIPPSDGWRMWKLAATPGAISGCAFSGSSAAPESDRP
ncbi:MAG: metalloprotease [Terriglobales bacterium]